MQNRSIRDRKRRAAEEDTEEAIPWYFVFFFKIRTSSLFRVFFEEDIFFEGDTPSGMGSACLLRAGSGTSRGAGGPSRSWVRTCPSIPK
jgi:hypothetical protein